MKNTLILLHLNIIAGHTHAFQTNFHTKKSDPQHCPWTRDLYYRPYMTYTDYFSVLPEFYMYVCMDNMTVSSLCALPLHYSPSSYWRKACQQWWQSQLPRPRLSKTRLKVSTSLINSLLSFNQGFRDRAGAIWLWSQN